MATCCRTRSTGHGRPSTRSSPRRQRHESRLDDERPELRPRASAERVDRHEPRRQGQLADQLEAGRRAGRLAGGARTRRQTRIYRTAIRARMARSPSSSGDGSSGRMFWHGVGTQPLAPSKAESPDYRGFSLIGAPRFELGTSSPPGEPGSRHLPPSDARSRSGSQIDDLAPTRGSPSLAT